MENNNLTENKDRNEISKQVSQRDNGEDSKENCRIQEIASTLRSSYKANAKELKGSDLEDCEKQVALKYAIDNNLWHSVVLSYRKLTPV
jgi:hypothetical protein